MGMSIEEHKEHLLDIMDSMPDDACGDWRDSLAYAIEIMRKYQKIEDIIEYHMLSSLPKKNMNGFQKDILEVIDNGKDD